MSGYGTQKMYDTTLIIRALARKGIDGDAFREVVNALCDILARQIANIRSGLGQMGQLESQLQQPGSLFMELR